jgi:hypothetical protein
MDKLGIKCVSMSPILLLSNSIRRVHSREGLLYLVSINRLFLTKF